MPLPALNLLVATVMVAAANQGFWKALLALQPTPAFLAAVGTCILVLVYLFLAAVTWGRLAKPALYLVLLTTAATTYFISRYGVVIDREREAARPAGRRAGGRQVRLRLVHGASRIPPRGPVRSFPVATRFDGCSADGPVLR